jgi:hypothetical protein
MDLAHAHEFDGFTDEYAASLFESCPVGAASGLTVLETRSISSIK